MGGRLEKRRGENDEREGQTDTKKSGMGTGKRTEMGFKGKEESEGRSVLEEPGAQLLGQKSRRQGDNVKGKL